MSDQRHEVKRAADWPALIIAALLVIVGGVMLWDASRLADLGGYSGVGPATIPRVVGICLVLLSVWTAVAAFRGDFPEREQQHVAPVIWIIAGLAAQLMLLNVAGFSIATGILFAFTARAFGKRNLAFSIPVGIVVAFIVWAIFSQLLMLHLPAGPLERLFFARG